MSMLYACDKMVRSCTTLSYCRLPSTGHLYPGTVQPFNWSITSPMVINLVRVHDPEDFMDASKYVLGKLRDIICQKRFKRPIPEDTVLGEILGYILYRYTSHRNDLQEIYEIILVYKYEHVSQLASRKSSQYFGSDSFERRSYTNSSIGGIFFMRRARWFAQLVHFLIGGLTYADMCSQNKVRVGNRWIRV